MEENNTKPEFEVYDVGHLYNLNFLIRRKIVKTPVCFSSSRASWEGSGPPSEDIMHLKHSRPVDRRRELQVSDRRRISCRVQRRHRHHDGVMPGSAWKTTSLLLKASKQEQRGTGGKIVRIARELGREI
jgi:hypothetical protein